MIKKLKLVLATSALLVGGVAGFAAAEGRGGDHADHKAMIENFDLNKDGKIDDTEKAAMKAKHEEMKKERLAKFDTNKDGKLDDGERKLAQDARAAEQFKKLDANGDGKLSLDEFKAARMGMRRHGRGGHGHHRGPGRGSD